MPPKNGRTFKTSWGIWGVKWLYLCDGCRLESERLTPAGVFVNFKRKRITYGCRQVLIEVLRLLSGSCASRDMDDWVQNNRCWESSCERHDIAIFVKSCLPDFWEFLEKTYALKMWTTEYILRSQCTNPAFCLFVELLLSWGRFISAAVRRRRWGFSRFLLNSPFSTFRPLCRRTFLSKVALILAGSVSCNLPLTRPSQGCANVLWTFFTCRVKLTLI